MRTLFPWGLNSPWELSLTRVVARVTRRPPAKQAREDPCPTADPVPPPHESCLRETSIAETCRRARGRPLEERAPRSRARHAFALKADPRAAELVAQQALRYFSFTRADVVSAYLAMQDELDPAPLLRALDQRGIALALPVVVAKGTPLAFRRWHFGDALVSGSFGTRHPAPSAETVRPTIVLVPLLAFDREGYRLGYGGGYYDRTLTALRKDGPLMAAGLAYAFQEIAALPRTPYDARLDCVVTEQGVRRFGAAGQAQR